MKGKIINRSFGSLMIYIMMNQYAQPTNNKRKKYGKVKGLKRKETRKKKKMKTEKIRRMNNKENVNQRHNKRRVTEPAQWSLRDGIQVPASAKECRYGSRDARWEDSPRAGELSVS